MKEAKDREYTVYVTGEVAKPGAFVVPKRPPTVLQAIALSGGLGPFAAARRIQVIRKVNGEEIIFPFNYSHYEKGRRHGGQHHAPQWRCGCRSGTRPVSVDTEMSRFGRAFRWVGASSWLLHVGVAALALSGPALAADWSLEFGASESLTFDDNLDLEEYDRDAGLISSTAFDLDLLALAKTYKINFAPRVSVQKTFSSGSPTIGVTFRRAHFS